LLIFHQRIESKKDLVENPITSIAAIITANITTMAIAIAIIILKANLNVSHRIIYTLSITIVWRFLVNQGDAIFRDYLLDND